MIMQQYKISYPRAEFCYAKHIRDNLKHEGEIIYPHQPSCRLLEDGSWLLITITGERLGTVSPSGTVRLT